MKTIALLVVCTLACGCTTWQMTSLQPQQFSDQKSPEEVRLTLDEGPRLKANHPVIVGDSLVWVESPWRSPRDSVRRAVPLSRIQRVEVHKIDGNATFGLLLLIGGVVGGVIAFLSAVSKG